MMTLREKKLLDYYLGGFLMAILKPVVWLLGRILRRDHDVTPRGEICFIKLLGAGSLVIAFPALLAIRNRYPHLPLSLITTRRIGPFAELLGIFERIHMVDDSSLTSLVWSGFRCLRRVFHVDTVVDLEVYSRLSTVLSTVTCARNRIGFYLETVFWRRHLHTHLIFFNRFSGVYHFYDAIAIHLGAQSLPMLECGEWFRKRLGPPSDPPRGMRRIAIGHGCSDLGRERMLNESQWLAVFQKRLSPEEAAEIILLGADTDRDLAERIIETVAPFFPHVVFRNLCGVLTPADSLRMLSSCREFWGIDSVLLHCARLLGLFCLSYWGPTDPKTRLRPIPGLHEEVYYDKIPCSPCIHVAEGPPCRGNNLCIQGLFHPLPDKETISWTV